MRKTHAYPVQLEDTVSHIGPAEETMTIGFIPLVALHTMYREMGARFLERNIRGLPEGKAVNRSIQQSLKRIVIDAKDNPKAFAFNHNGVTLYAQSLEKTGPDAFEITEPRLLNGAQTVTTLERFLKANEGNKSLADRHDVLDNIRVLCRIITEASPDFVTIVTINNNRQNPVDPWNLRANDMIQLSLQDKFRDDLGIYYERQERAFENLSDDELEDQGITQYKAVELTRLARTFLVSDGDIDKFSRFREVFEDDRLYGQVFDAGRLRADSRKIVLCYKAQFRLHRLINDIVEKGAAKYAYVHRARNLLWALLCQAILNDPKLEDRAEEFGKTLTLEAQYTEWLSGLATTKCRFVLSELTEDALYASKVADDNFSFMRSNATYERAMEFAYRRHKWVKKRLK